MAHNKNNGEDSRYLFVAGIATGMVMSLVSIMVIFQSISMLESKKNYIDVIGLAIAAALVIGTALSFAIRKLLK